MQRKNWLNKTQKPQIFWRDKQKKNIVQFTNTYSDKREKKKQKKKIDQNNNKPEESKKKLLYFWSVY